MGFRAAIASFYRNLFNFRGRASRAEFWYFALFNGLCAGLHNILLPLMVHGLGGTAAAIFEQLWAGYNLAIIVPIFALGIRRLHDIGRSGWWFLLALPVNLLEIIFIERSLLHDQSPIGPAFWALVAVAIFCSITKFVLDCRPGEQTSNAYGPNPLSAAVLTNSHSALVHT